jgi:signal transduction histidine kinase
MFRSLKPRQIVLDVSIAVACVLFELLIHGLPVSLMALAGMGVALALRRLSPGLALGIAWVTALAQVLLNVGPDPSNLAILAILYATASYGTPFIKWAGLASSGLGALVITAYLSLEAPGGIWDITQTLAQSAAAFFSTLAAFALSWTLGLLAKTWRKARESTQARVIAERARIDAQESVVVEQERNRIARDMHDVVAHSLAVVIAQADGARYAREHDPGAVDSALATISATAREALGDVRILLGQLRHSQSDSPQPALADLDRLIEHVRATGLEVRFEQTGTPCPLPIGAQLAVYRIVQEALTNALRHGDTNADSSMTFTWTPSGLSLEIRNRASTDNREQLARDVIDYSGHGLAGMSERAALAGGTFSASRDEAEFVVTATIPAAGTEVAS